MTMSIGTKVRVNDNYLSHVSNPDETLTGVRGKEGTVSGYVGSFLEVAPAENSEVWSTPFLFWPDELDKL